MFIYCNLTYIKRLNVFADLEIYHLDCSASLLTEKFPDLMLEAVSLGSGNGFVFSLDKIVGTNIDATLSFLRSIKCVKSLKVLSKGKDFANYIIKTAPSSSVVKVLSEKNCFLTGSELVKGGIEKYSFIYLEKPKGLFSELKEIGQAKIRTKEISEEETIKLLSHSTQPNLAGKERFFLQKAVENGFYDWPRKTNIKKLGKQIAIDRQVLRYNLRKIESKIMKETARGTIA